ncbi:MAG: FmdE family protein [Candidatus Marinarcus sp.]|uniref:FmdE family protein n=1 Tax=Candidatus Marinarcus sp. TaxID=3100987 RepID=UPI003AFFAF83
MNYPLFYNTIETITLQDKLSQFLGAFDEGIIEFSYLDIVKCAGHSCPTVLGAYLMTLEGLKALYKEELPQRGEIKVEFKEDSKEGTAGVVANVIGNITGATSHLGFKGIGGNFDRRHLMFFNMDIPSNVRFTRRDTGKSVDVFYTPNRIPPHEDMPILMQKCIAKTANLQEQETFAQLWQARVESIVNNIHKVISFTYN